MNKNDQYTNEIVEWTANGPVAHSYPRAKHSNLDDALGTILLVAASVVLFILFVIIFA